MRQNPLLFFLVMFAIPVFFENKGSCVTICCPSVINTLHTINTRIIKHAFMKICIISQWEVGEKYHICCEQLYVSGCDSFMIILQYKVQEQLKGIADRLTERWSGRRRIMPHDHLFSPITSSYIICNITLM